MLMQTAITLKDLSRVLFASQGILGTGFTAQVTIF